jgi:glycosyltransferase involved in cell wall biosynthesis
LIVTVRPLKIAVVLPDLRLGGAQRVLLQLAEQFVDAGYAVDIVALHDSGTLHQELSPRIRYLPLLPATAPVRMALAWSAFARLRRYLREEQPGAMLSSTTGTNLLSAAVHLCSGSTARLVMREAVALENASGHVRPALMRVLYRRADALIAVSLGVAEDLLALGLDPRLVHSIPNPVDRAKLLKLAAQPLPAALTDFGPFVISIGRLVAQKDHSCLIDAYAQCALRRSHRLIIVGGGELHDALRAQATRFGVGARVHFAGALENPYPLLAAADLNVLSSRWEGYPNVLLEGLALGVRVVATDCPSGPRELLRDGRYGELVPVGDAPALAAAMDRAVQSLPARVDALLAEQSPVAIAARYLAVLAP